MLEAFREGLLREKKKKRQLLEGWSQRRGDTCVQHTETNGQEAKFKTRRGRRMRQVEKGVSE